MHPKLPPEGDPTDGDGAIELQDVHKSLGGQQVLRGVSLRVEQGHVLALMGRSGAGKTVVLRHVIGLLRPDRGVVRIDGESLADARAVARARRKLGVLFQSGGLFDSLTALENVMFPLREQLHVRPAEAARQARAALALVRLEEAEAKRPGEMSGGMQKRLAFARAIVARPRLLVLDDPTAGLDPLMTDAVLDTIQRGQRELHASVLLITSDVRCAFRTADRMALLHGGRILLDAAPEEFERSTIPAVKDFLHRWKERRVEPEEPSLPRPSMDPDLAGHPA